MEKRLLHYQRHTKCSMNLQVTTKNIVRIVELKYPFETEVKHIGKPKTALHGLNHLAVDH